MCKIEKPNQEENMSNCNESLHFHINSSKDRLFTSLVSFNLSNKLGIRINLNYTSEFYPISKSQ